MQLSMFGPPPVEVRRTNPDQLVRMLDALWPEGGPWCVAGDFVEGARTTIDPGPPLEFVGRLEGYMWHLCDARMGAGGAIREARLRSMVLHEALTEVTGWPWVRRTTRPHDAPGEWTHIWVHGETVFEAHRLDGQVAVRLHHPACTTMGSRFPTVRGLLSSLDLRLERWVRLVDRSQPGAGDVLAALDHAVALAPRKEAQ